MKTKFLIIGSLTTWLALSAVAQTGGSGGTSSSGTRTGAGTGGTAGSGTSTGAGISGGLDTGATPASPITPAPPPPWGSTPVNPAGNPPSGTFSGLGNANSGLSSDSSGIGNNMPGLGNNQFGNRFGTNNLFLPTGRNNNPEPLMQLPPPAGNVAAPFSRTNF